MDNMDSKRYIVTHYQEDDGDKLAVNIQNHVNFYEDSHKIHSIQYAIDNRFQLHNAIVTLIKKGGHDN